MASNISKKNSNSDHGGDIDWRVSSFCFVSKALAELSFSCLTSLKCYLRSTMGVEHMNGLAVLRIHHAKSVTVHAVLLKFDSSGHRHIALAFFRVINRDMIVSESLTKWHD
jgi:hypothetical protein